MTPPNRGAKKRISPACFATIVVTPALVLQLSLGALGVWPTWSTWSGASVAIIASGLFWLVNYFIWDQAGRLRR